MTYVVIGAAFLIALIVVSVLRSGMKNVEEKDEAGAYISDTLELTQRSDRFTHTTRTTTKIESSSASKALSGK